MQIWKHKNTLSACYPVIVNGLAIKCGLGKRNTNLFTFGGEETTKKALSGHQVSTTGVSLTYSL